MAALLTLTECQDMLGVAGEGDLLILQGYIATATETVDRLCGPVLMTPGSDATVELHDGGTARIYVDCPPVFAVDTIVEYDNGGPVVLSAEDTAVPPYPADGYMLYRSTGQIVRRSAGSDSLFASGRQTVKVAYWPGRYDSLAEVPDRFRQACFMIVDRLWKLYQASGTATYGTDEWVPARAVPPMVHELLAADLRAPAVA